MGKKMIKFILSFAILLLLTAQTTLAGNENRTATAGALELLIPVGGSSVALSGADLASVGGVDALYWNPAGLARSTQAEALFSINNYIADIDITYLAVGMNSGIGSFAFSIKSLNFGDIPITTWDQPAGTGRTYSPSYITMGLTFARAMTNTINFGVTTKLVSEKIEDMTATGLAFDFGLQYQWPESGFSFGVAVKNLGPSMNFDGSNTEYFYQLPESDPNSKARPSRMVLQEFELPTTLEMGVSYNYAFMENQNLNLSSSFQNYNYGYDKARFGAEYGFQKFFFLRGGYEYSINDDDYIWGPTFGLGVNARPLGFDLQFDYTYRSADFFDANQYFTFKVAF